MAKKKEKKSQSSRVIVSNVQVQQKNDVQTRYHQDLSRYHAQIERTRQVFQSGEAA